MAPSYLDPIYRKFILYFKHVLQDVQDLIWSSLHKKKCIHIQNDQSLYTNFYFHHVYFVSVQYPIIQAVLSFRDICEFIYNIKVQCIIYNTDNG